MKNNLSRRELIKWGGMSLLGTAVGGLFLTGCSQGDGGATSPYGSGSTGGGSSGAANCTAIPSETAGDFAADHDVSVNAMRLGGIVRTDIKPSLNSGFYHGTATATGVPTTLTLKFFNVSDACKPLVGYAIYLWHADSSGLYSMYSPGLTQETYLRGIQITDSNGSVTFQTIFPGCESGRITHVNFEVYRNLGAAIDKDNAIKTSQFTFSTSTINTVYAVAEYSTSKTNYSLTPFASDPIFSDGANYQVATTSSATADAGVVASISIAIEG